MKNIVITGVSTGIGYSTAKILIENGYRVETIDGVKIWLENGWVLLRPSNTQPVIRMFVEANNEIEMKKITLWIYCL